MAINRLPDDDYIARLCTRKYVSNGVPSEGAFLLRERREGVEPDTELSVYWLNLLDRSTDGAVQVAALRDFLDTSPYDEMKRTARDLLARFRVAQVHNDVLKLVPTKPLTVKHVPREPRGAKLDPHSAIFGLDHGHESLKIAAFLAGSCEPYPAV